MEQRKESTSPRATTPEEGCTDRTGARRTGVNWVGSGENEGKRVWLHVSVASAAFQSKNNSDAMLGSASAPSNLVFVTFYHSLLTFMVELAATNMEAVSSHLGLCVCVLTYTTYEVPKNPHSRLFSWLPQLPKTVRGLSHGLNLEG